MAATNQQMQIMMQMLKNNLELITDYMDAEARDQKESELSTYINASISFIEREGIKLNYEDIGDETLVVMYASWLYDKRKDGVSVMPRMLRYNLNNRVFSEKVGEDV